MSNFISKKTYYKKSLVLFSIILILGMGIFVFNSNFWFITSFKPYYVKAYFKPDNYKEQVQNNNFISTVNNGINARSVPVLLYHGIIKGNDEENVSLDNFKKQMYLLKKAGYHTVTMNNFYEFIQGDRELPEKSFLLTD